MVISKIAYSLLYGFKTYVLFDLQVRLAALNQVGGNATRKTMSKKENDTSESARDALKVSRKLL